MNGKIIKKALVKRAADALEKLGVGGLILGIFQGEEIGIYAGLVFLFFSFVLTVVESKI